MFLKDNSQDTKSIHLIFECRGEKEDSQLEAEFRAIQNRSEKFAPFEIIFADKKMNLGGLQISDLIARPIGIKHLRPHQDNRAYDTIQEKFRRDDSGNYMGYGLKCFP